MFSCHVTDKMAGNMLFNKRTIIYLYNYYYDLVYSNMSVSNILYIKIKKKIK